MHSTAFMKVAYKNGNLLSDGCCGEDSLGDRALKVHTNEIMVMSLTHNMSNIGNSTHATHSPIVIAKYLDKSSPLLAKALTAQTELYCTIYLHEKPSVGEEQLIYSIEITKCIIESLTLDVPHNILHDGARPQEIVAFRYETIEWIHHKARTIENASWFTNK